MSPGLVNLSMNIYFNIYIINLIYVIFSVPFNIHPSTWIVGAEYGPDTNQ
jgi:hypothetical protein